MVKPQKPVLAPDVPARGVRPVVKKAPPSKKWTFSFRYWRQIDYFGLDQSRDKWFVALLQKLSDLSGLDMDLFKRDRDMIDHWRYHKINWNQRNIPVKRADLNWIPDMYLKNEEDYELIQFQISQALGRVIGFWDETYTFNIVLLDPLHNMQPSEAFNYRVRDCSPLNTDFADLVKDIESAKSRICQQPECPVNLDLKQLPQCNYGQTIIILRLNDEQSNLIASTMEKHNLTIEELLEYGTVNLE